MKKTIVTAALIVFYVVDVRAQNPRSAEGQNVSSGYLDPINVEGEYRRKRRDEESLNKRLDKQNKTRNRMVKKKIVDRQVELGNIITDKLERALDGKVSMDGEGEEQRFDDMSGGLQKKYPSETKAKIVLEKTPDFNEPDSGAGLVEVIPYMGIMSISGDNLDLDSRLSFGIAAESLINKKVRLGLDFNYSELKIEPLDEFDRTLHRRDIDYRRLGLDLGVKIFVFGPGMSKINPFVGASVGFSNTNLEYAYLSNLDSFDSDSFVASAILGTEIAVGDEFGVVLAAKFSKGFANNADTSTSRNEDQKRLNDIGTSIEDADYTSFNAGLVLKF